MIAGSSLARLFAAISLTTLAVACATGPVDGEDETIDGPDESVSVDSTRSALRVFQGTGGKTGGQSTAKCYSLTCPDGKQDGCLLPCIRAGATSTRCAKECGCSMTERECAPKIAM